MILKLCANSHKQCFKNLQVGSSFSVINAHTFTVKQYLPTDGFFKKELSLGYFSAAKIQEIL